MADGSVPAPQYPTNQQPPTQSLNPLQAIGLAQGAASLQAFQRDQASRQATGGGLPGRVATALRASPEASWGMPETTQKMLTQGSGQFDMDKARNQFVVDALGSAANDPKLTRDKVISLGTTLARNLKLPAHMVNNWLDDMPNDQPGMRQKLIQMRNLATGSANLSTPTATGFDQSGAPLSGPRDVYSYKTAGGRGLPTALPPGEQDLMGAPSERAKAIQATASTSPDIHANLENLRQDSSVMGNLGGPSQQVEKQLNQLSQRVAGFGITMTPDQLKASEAFDKVASQIALNQAKMLGGTDNTRSMSVGATPNSGMSRYGRDGVIDMLRGNQDAIDATREEWLNARNKGATAGTYDLFMHRLGKQLDPRIFQFNRLDAANQQRFYSQLPPAEIPAFEARYETAVNRGWVQKPKPAAQQ